MRGEAPSFKRRLGQSSRTGSKPDAEENHMRLIMGAALLLPPGRRTPSWPVGQDSKAVLDNGTVRIVAKPAGDNVAILDLSATPPRVLATVAAPHSVVGPPLSVALTPDERLGLVASAQSSTRPMRRRPSGQPALGHRPARHASGGGADAGGRRRGLGRLGQPGRHAGAGRQPQCRHGQRVPHRRWPLASVSTVSVGPAASGISHAQFTPDGRFALVTRDGDSMVSVLRVNGEAVTPAGQDITVGIRPYGMGITPDGRWAVVANIGRSTGDADTVSLISLAAEPFRATDTISVGPTPEGIQVSPDNRHVAVTVMNGSNRAANHPLAAPGYWWCCASRTGAWSAWRRPRLGSWGQGVAFNADGSRIFVQNMVEREIQAIDFDGARLSTRPERLRLEGGPSALRTAER
jgi:hypothetical protein